MVSIHDWLPRKSVARPRRGAGRDAAASHGDVEEGEVAGDGVADDNGLVLSAERLVTGRLVLTPLIEQDADVMVEVLGDEQMHTFTGGVPLSLDQLRSRYRRLVAGRSSDATELWFNWIVRLGGAQPVGVLQATVTADGT